VIIYDKSLPPLLSDYGILVPMLKGRAVRVYEEIMKEKGEEFIYQGNVPVLHEEDFLRAHSENFLQRCKKEAKKVIEETFELVNPDGSYHRYNPKAAKLALANLVDSFRRSVAFSFQAMDLAHMSGFAYFLGGGYHHSMSDRGRGFCLFNDIIIGARKYQSLHPGPIWVIDIDAHKGCGTAEMTKDDESIVTFSIHMKNGWPLDSEKTNPQGVAHPWFIPSNIDIGVAQGEESLYLEKLKDGLKRLESFPHPSLCIVVDGSDPYENDGLPSADLLRLTKEQCLERNKIVYHFLQTKKIPQAYLMSGGYGEENWEIHHQFLRYVLKKD
jgi:acetoin utilization deacetylase AcuC-like enzyme